MTASLARRVEAYEFGPFRADVPRRQLTRDGVSLPIKSRNFSLLLYLLENRGRRLTKEEIIRNIWTESSVGESNLIVNVAALRKLLGERPRDHRFILTHNGVGYEFVAPVREIHGDEVSAPPGGVLRKNSEDGVLNFAILPFRVSGDLDGYEYLPLGLTDTLITQFSQREGLAVRSTGSVARYIDSDAPLEGIATSLGVDVILDGSIHLDERGFSIAVQLVSMPDGRVRWANTYRSPVGRLLDVHAEVIGDLCRELGLKGCTVEVDRTIRHGTRDARAHQLYVRGKYHHAQFDPRGFFEAIRCFEAALEIDPSYVNALSGLALARHAVNWYGYLPAAEIVPEAEETARRALELDPDLPDALVALAVVRLTYHRDWVAARQYLLRAISLAPNASYPRFMHTFFLTRRQETMEEAEREARLALRLEPTSLMMNTNLGVVFHYRRKLDRAWEQLEFTLEMEPQDVWARFFLGWSLLAGGEYEAARGHFLKLEEIVGRNPWTCSILGMAEGYLGNDSEASDRLGEMEAAARSEYVPALYFAMVHHGCGRDDEAITWLERADEERLAYMCWLGVDANWDRLHPHPRFQALVESIGS